MKDKTIVDWIEQQMMEGNLSLKEILEQAKEMEKERMIDFANDLLAQNDPTYIASPNLAENYYNEMYGGKK